MQRTAMARAMIPAVMATCALAMAGLGCGGGQRADPAPAGGGQEAPAPAAGGGDATVPPDKIDEITHMLERKRSAMSRCLSMAVYNKELPRNAQGKVTVEIVISPSGTADQVKIVRATVQSKMLEDCVIGHIKEIAFPQLPAPFETSFTYGFEAM
jgi:hypothetical protein